VVFGQTYALLEHSHAALVTSGTATLETALFRVPQVVCYYFGGGKAVNFIFRHFFHVPYISLVNLIAGCEVVRELFGAGFTRERIRAELERILYDKAYRSRMLRGYDRVIRTLGPPGASQRTATLLRERMGGE
ncbi:MAG: lipid-A-disaccharide synthase, partial [Tannerella sp.]|jgi:lipid-A-disaccharide synthase|nr:lipid-A-disaccharide synthase [Tannerella sp.]